ncbi:hypothetical protein BD779DRAFT_111032 [Infundibulicybe gibba]|nr:hypothetical protein BD779DRAFT_111032 [Infundibulicybe gibba]
MIIPTIAFLIFLLRLTSATPFYQLPRNLPRGITHIAHDEERGLYYAYRSDDSLYGTYLAGNYSANGLSGRQDQACGKVSLEELTTADSWKKVEAFAIRKWGDVKRTPMIAGSSEKYPGDPVRSCPDTEPVPVEMGEKHCIESTVNLNGTMMGTSGHLRVIIGHGYSSTTTWSVMKATNFAFGFKAWATFKVPLIAEAGLETTLEAEIRNEKSSSSETKTDNIMTQEIWVTAVAGKICGGYVTTKSCTIKAKARRRFVTEGIVWFDHEKKVGGHYRWAVTLQESFSIDERSDWMEMKADMKTSITVDYGGRCR